MKKTLFLVSLTAILFFACGKKSEKKQESAEKTTKQAMVMTVEKSAQLENELATLLMEKYWKDFKGKDYEAVKNLYAQYEKEKEEIQEKYGVVKNTAFDSQKYSYWKRDHREELKEYRKNHSEYDFYAKYPEFLDANKQLLSYAMAKFKNK